jgi:hypothetical protein
MTRLAIIDRVTGRFVGSSPIPALKRFVSKIVILSDGCWLWTAHVQWNGYGQFWDGKKLVPAHRWAWEHEHGPLPFGFEPDHLCRNRACVNPDHQEPVTKRDNILRGAGFSAVNARKSICPRGHLLIRVRCSPGRVCIVCRRAGARARYHRKKGVRLGSRNMVA